jgi:hypothetical protein
MKRPRHHARQTAAFYPPPGPAPVRLSRCRLLIVIDNAPLKNAVWANFHAARKRVEKAARDLHRHEQTDTPAFNSWLHGTFPQLVTALRELAAEVERKGRNVEQAQFTASMTGRSVKKVWREHREYEADPEAYERAHPQPEPAADDSRRPHGDPTQPDESDDEFEDFFKGLFGDEGDDAASPFGGGRRPNRSQTDHADAKELYRRLVQHLHPDRGGEWTPARERLWHEVQQAWAARDADWLARLEIEWETANDTVSPDSSIGRLRRAIAELDAARRDTERKLRECRKMPAWRFSLAENKRPQLLRNIEASLRGDFEQLKRHLAYLNETITAWEAPASTPHRQRRGRGR